MAETRQVHQVHEVTSDGVSVWINVAGGCVGRFGLHGIELQRPLGDTVPGSRQLFCKAGESTVDDWKLFVTKAWEHLGVHVPTKHRPRRFRPTTVRGGRVDASR